MLFSCSLWSPLEICFGLTLFAFRGFQMTSLKLKASFKIPLNWLSFQNGKLSREGSGKLEAGSVRCSTHNLFGRTHTWRLQAPCQWGRLFTVLIWIPDVPSIQMVESGLDSKWSGFCMVDHLNTVQLKRWGLECSSVYFSNSKWEKHEQQKYKLQLRHFLWLCNVLDLFNLKRVL